MDVTHLLLATLLVCLCFLTACSHLAPEEKPRDDRSLRSNFSMNLLDSSSVSIVALNKKSKKISIREVGKKRSLKKKASVKKVAPSRDPPVPCVVTCDSCRQPAPACCDSCASCNCRCSCHVLNRNCSGDNAAPYLYTGEHSSCLQIQGMQTSRKEALRSYHSVFSPF